MAHKHAFSSLTGHFGVASPWPQDTHYHVCTIGPCGVWLIGPGYQCFGRHYTVAEVIPRLRRYLNNVQAVSRIILVAHATRSLESKVTGWASGTIKPRPRTLARLDKFLTKEGIV